MVQLSDELVGALSQEAQRQGLSRSALIRTVLQQYLETIGQDAVGRQIAEGYRRVPPTTPDEWGQLSTLTDRATADALVRFDAEERLAGSEPW